MKYIRSFETLAGFQAVQTTLDRPNVSLIKATMGLNYLPYIAPVVPQYDYVEIGGVKWATMNLGANSIIDYGLYFQWGDTQGYTDTQGSAGTQGTQGGVVQKSFDWTDYKYSDGETGSQGTISMSKYNSTDGKTVLEASDDAVAAAWGGNWRMPTTAEYVALGDAVNTVWTADYQGSGVSGLICTDKTDSTKTLFFPACGLCGFGGVYNIGSSGLYWSSSLDSSDVQYAYTFGFYDGEVRWQNSVYRCTGFPIRGIYDDSNS